MLYIYRILILLYYSIYGTSSYLYMLTESKSHRHKTSLVCFILVRETSVNNTNTYVCWYHAPCCYIQSNLYPDERKGCLATRDVICDTVCKTRHGLQNATQCVGCDTARDGDPPWDARAGSQQ
jgi:hypothetical protein